MAAYIFHAMKSQQEGHATLDALLSSIAEDVPGMCVYTCIHDIVNKVDIHDVHNYDDIVL